MHIDVGWLFHRSDMWYRGKAGIPVGAGDVE
jgi:hypothetical protein